MNKIQSIANYVRENLTNPIIRINIENGEFKISNNLFIKQISIGKTNTTIFTSGDREKISNDLVTDFENYTLLIEKFKSALDEYLDDIYRHKPNFIKISKINDERYQLSLDHFTTKYNDIETIINITKDNEINYFLRENNKPPTKEEIITSVKTKKILKKMYNSIQNLYNNF